MAEAETPVEQSNEEQVYQTRSSDSGSSSSWGLGGWFSYAKEKSKQTIDLLKKDLTEFQSTMRTDTVTAISRTVDTVKQKVANADDDESRANITKLLDDVSKVAVNTPDVNDAASCCATEDGELKTLDQLELRIHELTRNPETFLTSPKNSPDFDKWNAKFDASAQKQEISEILIQYSSVRKFYNEFVPAKIAHSEFWRNVLYRIEQLRAEQATREQLKQRASQQVASTDSSGSDKWEDEDEGLIASANIAVKEPAESQLDAAKVSPKDVQSQSEEQSPDAAEVKPPANDKTLDITTDLASQVTGDTNDASQDVENCTTDVLEQKDTPTDKDKEKAKPTHDSQDSNDDWEKWDE